MDGLFDFGAVSGFASPEGKTPSAAALLLLRCHLPNPEASQALQATLSRPAPSPDHLPAHIQGLVL